MPINLEQIEHIALLARLELSAAEKKKFLSQLSSVLSYFEKLKEVDTSHIEPLAQNIVLSNIHRNDEIKNSDEYIKKAILAAAPRRKGDYFQVNKIL